MFAVIRSGGKQHRVEVGETLRVELLEGDVGTTVALGDVLLIEDGEKVTLGQPVVAGASVTAKIVKHDRAAKVIAFKRRRRKGFHQKKGHRQSFTEIEIAAIKA